jgi:hypothetical protein
MGGAIASLVCLAFFLLIAWRWLVSLKRLISD